MSVIYLHSNSALEYWRSISTDHHTTRAAKTVLKDCQNGCLSDWQLADLTTLGVYEKPVHVLVAGLRCHVSSENARYHSCNLRIPSGAYSLAADGVCVPSVEFTFLQLAEAYSVPELIRLGYELCGEYSLYTRFEAAKRRERIVTDAIVDPKMRAKLCRGFYSRKALTSPAALRSFLKKTEGYRGLRKALRALSFIASGSESPLESEIAMRLSLSPKLGGYGLPLPEMNATVALNLEARRVYSKKECRPDLSWPVAQLAIEYDSDDEHTGADRISSDAARRSALTIMGYDVVTVTRVQRNSINAFDSIARLAAKRLGKRLRIRATDFEDERLKLYKMFLNDK